MYNIVNTYYGYFKIENDHNMGQLKWRDPGVFQNLPQLLQ
jgi:hypothetical protein